MKHIESGRSMVEMLGVLAVMGVISIGGLYGYTYAMKRHRANELLNEANKRAVMVASQLMAGKEPGNVTVEEPNTPYGQFNSNLKDVGDKFKMTVSGLDEEVCALMKGLAGGPIRRVECVAEETSTFTAEMYFNKDLSTEERASDYNNNPSGCASKDGYKYCDTNQTCIKQEEECPIEKNTCEEVLECVHGSWNEAECKCDCDTGWYGKICDYYSECDGVTFLGGCEPCSSPRSAYVDRSASNPAKECQKCDRFWSRAPDDSALFDFCNLCNMEPSRETTEEACSACEGVRKIFVMDGVQYCGLINCPEGKFHQDDGACHSCDLNDVEYNVENSTKVYIEYQPTTSSEHAKECDGTDYPRDTFIYKGKSYSGLRICPENTFRGIYGNCELCSQNTKVLSTPERCAECVAPYSRHMDGDYCVRT